MQNTVKFSNSSWHTEKAKQTFTSIICLACLFLFVISAYDKIADHNRFLKGLLKVGFLSSYAVFISYAVPVCEILVSLMLIFPKTYKLGLYGFLALMSTFTLYIASMLLWAEKLPCHCNLIIEKLSFSQHLLFNLGFIVFAIVGLWLLKKTKKI